MFPGPTSMFQQSSSGSAFFSKSWFFFYKTEMTVPTCKAATALGHIMHVWSLGDKAIVKN